MYHNFKRSKVALAIFQRTLNSGEYQTKVILDDALVMAHDAFWGDPCEGEFSPISNRPCYAIDFFTPEYLRGEFDQGTKDFLFDTEIGKTTYKQDTLEAYVTGDIYDLRAGTIGAAFGVSYQTDEIRDTPGAVTMAGNVNINLDRESWNYNYSIRYVDSVSNDHLYTNGDLGTYRGDDVRYVSSAPRVVYHTFSTSKTFGEHWDLTVGVNNLFDKKPPKGSPSRASTVDNAMLYSQYDQMGRRVFANLTYGF